MSSFERAVEVLTSTGIEPGQARTLVGSLDAAGLRFVDASRGDFVVRWVDVVERAVPPEADTIIRTITRTTNGHAVSVTHWLDGLQGPPEPPR
ncbi:MAG TPA: hypothetical protein VH062_07710 [Polyangiaceae bacterium]|jgi:hypothetical protein|nr:hypothetical protein [Polyangiaceae bacterium]